MHENRGKAGRPEKVKHVPVVDGDEAKDGVATDSQKETAATASPADAPTDEAASEASEEPTYEVPDQDPVEAAEKVVEQAAKEASDAQKAAEPDPLEKALADAADARDRCMRLQADWDNYRKRNAAERLNEQARAAERVVKELLPVIDDFERAIQHASEDPDVATMLEGIQAVHGKFLSILAKEKVTQIDPEGEAFDVNRDQAVGTVEDSDVFDETVMQVYQKGYEMAGRVIRPAMVTVSTGGPKRPTMDDDTVVDSGGKKSE